MNILILCNHLDPGGISRYAYNLSCGLKRLGDTVWVGSRGGEWQERFAGSGIATVLIPIHTKSVLSVSFIRSWRQVEAFVSANQVDVIHANTRITQCIASLVWWKRKIPYVSTFHGFYRAHFLRKLWKCAGNISIAVSNAVKKSLIQGYGITAAAVAVIYNGIDTGVFLRCPDSFNGGSFRLGILSRLSSEKSIDTVVREFPKVLTAFPGTTLAIAGQGKMEASLRKQVLDLDLTEQVFFKGVVAPEDFLKTIDILLFPSRQEGLGFAVLEAKAAGKIVIASTAGGLTELIIDSCDGFLLDTFSAERLVSILRTIQDSEAFLRLSRNARESARAFTIEKMAEQTKRVYDRAVDSVKRV